MLVYQNIPMGASERLPFFQKNCINRVYMVKKICGRGKYSENNLLKIVQCNFLSQNENFVSKWQFLLKNEIL